MKILQQGAEAKIILVAPRSKKSPITKSSRSALTESGAKQLIASHSEPIIIKDRISKSYRIPELDKKIRKSRTRSEAKLLTKASEIICAPKPFFIPEFNKIKMPYIKGKKLSENFDGFSLKEQKEICKTMGEEIAKLHNADIIHGDLTTSNMILSSKPIVEPCSTKSSSITKSPEKRLDKVSREATNRASAPIIFFIDFGLGYISRKIEDKAVDLHLLKQALEAKHFKNWKELFEKVKEGYKKIGKKEAQKVLERLIAVEKRGRYKHK